MYEGGVYGGVEIRLQGIDEALGEGEPDSLGVFKMVVGTENNGRVGGGEKELGGGSAAHELDAVAGGHIAQWGEGAGGLDGSVKSIEHFVGERGRLHQESDDSDGAE